MKALKESQRKSVVVFGLSESEVDFVKRHLPSSDTEVYIAGCLTDIVMSFKGSAIVVRVDDCDDDDLNCFLWFYEEVPHFSETVVFIGDCPEAERLNPKFLKYSNFQALESELEYVLLSAWKKKGSANSFSNTLVVSLTVLKLIAENPGISTKEIAEKLEIAPRTVTRYIESLNVAGESIVYDRKTNGWSLEFGESLLVIGV